MIKKMKFINIMGPSNDLSRVKDTYLQRFDIQIEDAVKEFSSVSKDITFFSATNQYLEPLKEIERIAEKAAITSSESTSDISMEESLGTIQEMSKIADEYNTKIDELNNEKKSVEDLIRQITPFVDIAFDLTKIYHFNFISYSFGRLPVFSYNQFKNFLYNDESIIFVKTHTDEQYIWGVYFVPRTVHERVDAIFASLYFEKIQLSSKLEGKPMEEYEKLNRRLTEIDQEIASLQSGRLSAMEKHKDKIANAYKKIKDQFNFDEMKKYIARTKDDFYIIVGWMVDTDALALAEEVRSDKYVTFIIKDESSNMKSDPPTKLSNFKIFKPFEFLVSTYGMPEYHEIDPTPFLAMTYTILFGIMFGDLGQGLLLSLAGFLFYKKTKQPLGAILGIVGISSAFFGVLFGSVFGFETIIPALFMRPLENATQILTLTIGFGILLNICAILLHIINALKIKDYDALFFDPNGIAGLFFYISAILILLSIFVKSMAIPFWLIILTIIIPIILIALREPLTNMVLKRPKLIHQKASEYFIEMIFETIEILLSYTTNTISFIRVGAFALSHAGIMSVVLLLAGFSHDSGSLNPVSLIVIVIGNIFVMCLEGMIVGIQVLRLQYYEMFSRFFKGTGKVFKSFRDLN